MTGSLKGAMTLEHTDKNPTKHRLSILALLFCMLPAISQASVSYVFSVSEYPASPFHQPFQAELVFSDDAVAAGVAHIADIESLALSGGTSMPTADPVTMDYLHPAFVNLEVIFSDDRETISSLAAEITPSMNPVDHWVLYRPHPPSSDFFIHEHIGYLSSQYVRLETTLLPVPPKYYFSYFSGEWQRQHEQFEFGKFFAEQIACFPFCPWPWFIILLVILIAVLFGIKRKVNAPHHH